MLMCCMYRVISDVANGASILQAFHYTALISWGSITYNLLISWGRVTDQQWGACMDGWVGGCMHGLVDGWMGG